MAQVNPGVSCTVPIPILIPLVTLTHDLEGLPLKKKPKQSRIEQVMVKTILVHGYDHNALNTELFWMIFSSFWSSRIGKSIPAPLPIATHTRDPCGFRKPVPFPKHALSLIVRGRLPFCLFFHVIVSENWIVCWLCIHAQAVWRCLSSQLCMQNEPF